MEELSGGRKRCRSQADLSTLFLCRFQGKINRVGKAGLMELFFPKSRPSTESSGSPRRNLHSSVSAKTNKSTKSVSLPKISRTETEMQRARKPVQVDHKWSGNPAFPFPPRQKQKLKIQKSNRPSPPLSLAS